MATISSIPELAEQLRIALARTTRRLRQEAGGGLSPTLTAALASIERHGPLTPSELATRERVQRPTATKFVARLEADGLVTRTADPEDGRSFLIAITPDGGERLRAIRTRKDAYLATRLRKLPADDRATLERAAVILERMLEEEHR
jgi:DNA-binding MarR family transcriptional regulator